MTWYEWVATSAPVPLGITLLAVAVLLALRWSARHAARLERRRRSGESGRRRARAGRRRVMRRG